MAVLSHQLKINIVGLHLKIVLLTKFIYMNESKFSYGTRYIWIASFSQKKKNLSKA